MDLNSILYYCFHLLTSPAISCTEAVTTNLQKLFGIKMITQVIIAGFSGKLSSSGIANNAST
jgi:hypothetical protein